MQLDTFNKILGVRTPVEVFRCCPRCKCPRLFDFEGEVFCQRCSWTSIDIHAEVLADVQLRRQQERADSASNSDPFGAVHLTDGRATTPHRKRLSSPRRPIQSNPSIRVSHLDIA